MTACPRYSGHIIFSMRKATTSMIVLCIRTAKVLSFWNKMAEHPAASGPDTSIFDITLSPTVQTVGKSRSNIALLQRWLGIISQNHSKVGSSTNSVTASLIYKLILQTYLRRITGVCWDETTRTRLDSRLDSRMRQHKPIRPKGQKGHTRWWHEQEGSYIMNQMSMQSWCQWPNPLGDGT